MIISIANQKGGCGKTTIATNLAAYLTLNDQKVLLVDTDIQGSSIDFRTLRADNKKLKQFPCVTNIEKTAGQDIKSFTNFDFIVVDTGGRGSRALRSVLLESNLVLIPIIPSNYDFWGSEQTFETVAEIKTVRKELKAFAFFSMVRHNRIASEIEDLILEFKEKYPVKFIPARIYDRVVYKHSVGEGKSIFEMGAKKDDKAIEEFEVFYNIIKQEF